MATEKRVEFTLRALTEDAKARLEEINARLDKLTAGARDIRVGVDDKAARLEVDAFAAKLEALRVKDITPNISLKGYFRTLAELDRLELKMDAISRKSIAPSGSPGGVDRFLNLFSFLPGVGTAGGGAGVAGTAAAGTAGSGGGGGGLAALGPYGIGAAVAAGVLAAPALLGTGATLIAGGGALLGAGKLGSSANTQLTALQATQTSAQQAYASYPSAANRTALDQANQAVNVFQKQNAPALQAYGAFQGLGSAASGAFTTALTSGGKNSALAGITAMLGQLSGFAAKLGPLLAPLLQAGTGGLAAFIKGLEPALQKIIPEFAQFVRAFEPFMKEMGTTFGVALQGIVRGLQNLEPAFLTSAHFIHGFVAVVAGLFDGITRFIGDAVAIIGDIFRGKWSDIWNRAQDFIRYATDGFRTLMLKLVVWIGSKFMPGIFDTIKNGLALLPGMMWNAGKDAISGLIRGLEAVPVIGPMISLGSRLVGGLKSALGIKSPSTVAMGIGRNFTEGFYLGLNQAGNGVGVNVTGTGGAGGAGGRGGGITLQVNPGAASGGLDALFIQWLRHAILVTGGGGPHAVQRALGQTA